MAEHLQGKTIAFLAAPEGVEQIELTDPWAAVRDAGGGPRLLSTASGEIQAFNHLDKADTFPVDDVVSRDLVGQCDALVLPGGVANPDFLRIKPEAVAFVRAFFDSGKPVAAICHAPWTMIEAGVVEGRTLTSWPSLATDLRNAGARWVDQEICVDGRLTTSRGPQDLRVFCRRIVEELARTPAAAQAQAGSR